MASQDQRLVLVTRRSRLDELVARFNTVSQAQFYVEHLGADFGDYEREHQTGLEAARRTREILGGLGRLHSIDRAFLPNYLFGPNDLVVALGQDGLVANTLKYLGGRPLIGVNPDPARWDGVLLPFQVGDLSRIVPEAIAGGRKTRAVTFARASLNTGESLLAVNDLFIGAKTHVSARYQISLGGKSEQHSSSGVIISTGLGSSGWLKSIRHGASVLAGRKPQATDFPWEKSELVFSVREPFPSRTTQAALVGGKVTPRSPLVLTSAMAENGVIFSDGMESDFLVFNSGTTATVEVLPEAGRLVV